jgi:hypothetical protein
MQHRDGDHVRNRTRLLVGEYEAVDPNQLGQSPPPARMPVQAGLPIPRNASSRRAIARIRGAEGQLESKGVPPEMQFPEFRDGRATCVTLGPFRVR